MSLREDAESASFQQAHSECSILAFAASVSLTSIPVETWLSVKVVIESKIRCWVEAEAVRGDDSRGDIEFESKIRRRIEADAVRCCDDSRGEKASEVPNESDNNMRFISAAGSLVEAVSGTPENEYRQVSVSCLVSRVTVGG